MISWMASSRELISSNFGYRYCFSYLVQVVSPHEFVDQNNINRAFLGELNTYDNRNKNYKCIEISKRSARFFAVHFPQFFIPIFHALQVKIEFAPSYELSVVFRPISLVDISHNIIFIFKLFIAYATQQFNSLNDSV